MPIQFDTLAEVQAFCSVFEPISGSTKMLKANPANTKTARKQVSLKTAKSSAKPVKLPKGSKIMTLGSRRPSAQAPLPKASKPKRENSLTNQVRFAIDELVAAKAAFFVKDVVTKVSETNTSINKPTVISIASKLLSTQYSHIATEDRPSSGPRPMRMYLPVNSI